MRGHYPSSSSRSALGYAIACIVVLASLPAAASELTVTNGLDVINGDVSGPAALLAQPGPDGISIREAIQALNKQPGPHTIRFAVELSGQTIALNSPLSLTRDGLTLTGLTDAGGQPAITLDGRGITTPNQALVFISASDVGITHFNFTGVAQRGLYITASDVEVPSRSATPETATNIRVEHNVFDNGGVAGGNFPTAIRIITNPRLTNIFEDAVNATIANVRIANNAFRHFGDSGVVVTASGTNCTVQDLVIQANTFDDIMYQLELSTNTGSHNRIVGTRIIGNTFTNGATPVNNIALYIGTIGRETAPQATDNLIDDTVIQGNRFLVEFASMSIIGGQSNGPSAIRNVVRNTQILDNLIVGGSGIVITGGGPGSSLNQVQGVRIANNTIVTHPMAALRVDANRAFDPARPGDAGNANEVTGVSAVNTIFQKRRPEVQRPEDEIAGELRPDQVRYSVTTVPAFAGSHGNIAVDPKFADPDRWDFQLQPGSAAIDAGTSEAAPDRDLNGRSRVDEPSAPNRGGGTRPDYDIGAFEFSGRPSAYFTVVNFHQALGRVTSSPPGIDCGRMCWAAFDVGSELTLIPVPEPGAAFSHWTGDPDCGRARIVVSGPQTCTAVFVRNAEADNASNRRGNGR